MKVNFRSIFYVPIVFFYLTLLFLASLPGFAFGPSSYNVLTRSFVPYMLDDWLSCPSPKSSLRYLRHPGFLVLGIDMSRHGKIYGTFFRRRPKTGTRHSNTTPDNALGTYLRLPQMKLFCVQPISQHPFLFLCDI